MTKFTFLREDYESPTQAGNYLKLQEGENKIRILSNAIDGWEDWTVDRKPVRFSYDQKPRAPISPDKPIKHFWACIVWNYNEKKVQIYQITQASIRRAIEALGKDEDWGNPFYYDLKINKTGEGIETKYSVTPAPQKPIDEAIRSAFYAKRCCLQFLFTGDDPFSCSPEEATLFALDVKEEAPVFISQEQLDALNEVIGDNSTYRNKILSYYKIDALSKLALDQFDIVLDRAKQNKRIMLEKEDSILEA